MRDAASLVDALTSAARGEADVVNAIADYEEQMRAEVFPIMRASADPRYRDADVRPDGLYATRP